MKRPKIKDTTLDDMFKIVKPEKKIQPLTKEEEIALYHVDRDKLCACDFFPGAHVATEGVKSQAIDNAIAIGAYSFALFLTSARRWAVSKPSDSDLQTFKEKLQKMKMDPKFILPHAGYFVNFASPDSVKRGKSVTRMILEMELAHKFGLKYLNVHPGAGMKQTRTESISTAAKSINEVFQDKRTGDVAIVLECTAGAGSVLGGKLEDLADIKTRVDPKFQDRVLFCLDTCHAHSAGYDLSSKTGVERYCRQAATLLGADCIIGWHFNDSKTPCDSHKDRHENISRGSIGEAGFRALMFHPLTSNRPLILETVGPYDEEIELLMKYAKEAEESHVKDDTKDKKVKIKGELIENPEQLEDEQS
ncbi:AP endonuclease 2 like protein [Aduncisulcus paluster]|uniref:AP endonuclease 2 like protein n=1 Tax=Aduncisulcus paluster TaxID=2918883 RepID=A0ABQ5JYS4_9EUKA|nr:AP endonuclease 2 like protein [Aduncisulcus paluster]